MSSRRFAALVALVPLLSAFGMPTAFAQAAPALRADPASLEVGQTLHLDGTTAPAACSAPAGIVVITVADGPELARIPADTSGAFATDLVLPALSVGDHRLTSTCELGDLLMAPVELATATIEVLQTPANAVADGPVVTAEPPTPDPAPSTPSTPSQPSAADSNSATEAEPTPVAEPRPDLANQDAGAGAPPDALSRTDAPTEPEPVAQQEAQQIEPPASEQGWEPAPARWGPAKDIRKLTDPALTAQGMSAAAMLLLAFTLLIGFPATMFNGTYRRHYDQIADWWRGRFPGATRVLEGTTARAPGGPLLAMATFGTFAAAALDPGLRFEARTLGLLAGLAVVVGLSGWLGWWPTKRTSDGYGNDGNYRAYPLGLVIAVMCVLLTRFGNLHPGYLYGLLFAYEVRGRWSVRDNGLTFLQGFAAVYAVAMLAWLGLSLWEPAAGAEPGLAAIALDTILGGLTIAGIQGVVFGMIPLQFTPGHEIWTWSRAGWAALWVPGVLSLAVLLSTPNRDLLTVQAEEVSVVRAGLAFVGFCILSAAFWNHWRRRATPLTVQDILDAGPDVREGDRPMVDAD